MMESSNHAKLGYIPGIMAEQAKSLIQHNPEKLTLRENIENRISYHEREIAALKLALRNITEKPLSEVTIGDLNLAMRY